MKICFINADYPPNLGGMAAVANSLAIHLSNKPEVAEIKVIAFNNSQPRHVRKGKIEVVAFSAKSWPAMFVLSFGQLWNCRYYDAIHITSLFPIGFIALMIAKYVFGRRVFVSVYGTDALAKKSHPLTFAAKKWTLQNCHKVLAVSKSTKEMVRKRYGLAEEKISVVYAGMSDDVAGNQTKDIRPLYGLAAEDFVVLSVGRLIKRKGVDDLIKAMELIGDKSIKLLIVGEGDQKDHLTRLAQESGNSSRIIFAGKVADVSDFYRSADVFSMPSKYLADDGDIEGLGLVYLEAQSFGLPVIGTASGGIPEAMSAGQTGFLVAEGDVAALAEKILLLKNDQETYQKFSAAAQAFVAQNFSWSEIASQLIEKYRN